MSDVPKSNKHCLNQAEDAQPKGFQPTASCTTLPPYSSAEMMADRARLSTLNAHVRTHIRSVHLTFTATEVDSARFFSYKASSDE
jgi:hypothetical protein